MGENLQGKPRHAWGVTGMQPWPVPSPDSSSAVSFKSSPPWGRVKAAARRAASSSRGGGDKEQAAQGSLTSILLASSAAVPKTAARAVPAAVSLPCIWRPGVWDRVPCSLVSW